MRATAPGQSALLLLDVVALLERREVDYAVIGALAASVHGVDLLIGLRGLERAAFEKLKVFAGGLQDLSDARRAIESDRQALETILLRRLAKAYGSAASDGLEELLRN